MFKKIGIVVVALLLVAVGNPAAHAWNAKGHRLVASIAYRQLAAADRDALAELLKSHPRYESDFAKLMPTSIAQGTKDEQQEWLFGQAAVWPDFIRGLKGDESDRYHRGTWHYINWPHYLSDAEAVDLASPPGVNRHLDPAMTPILEQNLMQTIARLRAEFVDTSKSSADRAVMLCWMLHTMGDLHQPMHGASLFCKPLFVEGDRGGNSILTKQSGNLHAVWDNALGNDDSQREVNRHATLLLADTSMMERGKKSLSSIDQKTWLEESHALAVEHVYDTTVMSHVRVQMLAIQNVDDFPPLSLADDYLRNANRVSEHRAIEAGYRIAAVFQKLLQP